MHFELVSIGRQGDKNLALVIEDYTNRLRQLIKTEWVYLKNSTEPSVAQIRQKEALALCQKIDTVTSLVVLDGSYGKQYSSEAFATVLKGQIENPRYKKIIFMIGGAYGIDPSLIKRADLLLSLSQLTFPHQIVRLLLVEQLYRSMMILKNIPYHH